MDGPVGGSTLRCEVIRTLAGLEPLHAELARLAESRDSGASLVQHPDWFAIDIARRGGDSAPHVVVARDGGGVIRAYLPLRSSRRKLPIVLGPFSVSAYTGNALRTLGTGVVAEPTFRPSAEAAIGDCLRNDPGVRAIVISESRLPNRFADLLTRGRRRFTAGLGNPLDQVAWSIPAPGSLDAWLANFTAKQRHDLNRRERKLYKTLGTTLRLDVVTERADVAGYLRRVESLHRRSWQARLYEINWEAPRMVAFFESAADRGWLQGYVLQLGDQPIAYLHGLRFGGQYVFEYTGYDPEFARHGVGSTMVYAAVRDILTRHPEEGIDCGYGDNLYKRVLATRSDPAGEIYLARGVLPSLMLRWLSPAVRWGYAKVRAWQNRPRPTAPNPPPRTEQRQPPSVTAVPNAERE